MRKLLHFAVVVHLQSLLCSLSVDLVIQLQLLLWPAEKFEARQPSVREPWHHSQLLVRWLQVEFARLPIDLAGM